MCHASQPADGKGPETEQFGYERIRRVRRGSEESESKKRVDQEDVRPLLISAVPQREDEEQGPGDVRGRETTQGSRLPR